MTITAQFTQWFHRKSFRIEMQLCTNHGESVLSAHGSEPLDKESCFLWRVQSAHAQFNRVYNPFLQHGITLYHMTPFSILSILCSPMDFTDSGNYISKQYISFMLCIIYISWFPKELKFIFLLENCIMVFIMKLFFKRKA